eukprot:TRINITY_DN1071_c0_g1_i1.p1 TRINITY_DN1071_c0_g1~~TRINITY_DN1071_c0_g1_i1.p1  ORF type:complete len:92 (+),score=16.73 TRINITY_DN1071_c0_g1_i1:563-838(+)
MSKKQFALEKAEVGVQAMEKIGQAQWRMPNKILQFYESFTPYLRMGPMTAREVLNNLDDQKPLKNQSNVMSNTCISVCLQKRKVPTAWPLV